MIFYKNDNPIYQSIFHIIIILLLKLFYSTKINFSMQSKKLHYDEKYIIFPPRLSEKKSQSNLYFCIYPFIDTKKYENMESWSS